MEKLEALCSLAIRHAGVRHAGIPRLAVHSVTEPNELSAVLYEPTAFIVLQGVKRTLIGDQVLEHGPGQTMVVGAEIAAMSQVCEASSAQPFLALELQLDPAVLMNVVLYLSETSELRVQPGFGFSIANSEVIGAWQRLLEVLDRPKEVAVMALHLEHELMFRMMMGPHAEILRQIAGIDSRLSQVRKVMAWIREHYTEQLSVESMAAVACMSESVFHRRFKAVTALSPLQYQKQIRLHEARRRLVAREADAVTVAFEVGYKSNSQFSREYKRLFGSPPRRDAGVIRAMTEVVGPNP